MVTLAVSSKHRCSHIRPYRAASIVSFFFFLVCLRSAQHVLDYGLSPCSMTFSEDSSVWLPEIIIGKCNAYHNEHLHLTNAVGQSSVCGLNVVTVA